MRTDAVGRDLADAGVVACRVVHAEDAALAIEVILGGVEDAAVGGEEAVALEVAVLRRREHRIHRQRVDVDRDREPAGPPREHHGGAGLRADGGGVAARIDPVAVEHLAVRADDRHVEPAGSGAAGGHVGRLVRVREWGAERWRQRQQEGAEPGEDAAAGGAHQSPSIALKPATKPSSSGMRWARILCAPASGCSV